MPFNLPTQPAFRMRTSGYSLYQFSFFLALCVWFVVMIFREMANHGLDIIYVFGVVFFGYAGVVIFLMLISQKIEIAEHELVIPSASKVKWFPMATEMRLELHDITRVIIARSKNLQAMLGRSQQIENPLNNLIGVVGNHGVMVPVPLGYAAQYSQLLCIERKNKKPILLPLKAYSKANIRRFMAECVRRKIALTVDAALGFSSSS